MGARAYWKGRAVVYRHYDATGRLLYIGSTIDLARRTSELRQQWWFQIVTRTRLKVHPTLEAARAAESVAIQEEQPAFNLVGAGRRSSHSDYSKTHWTEQDRALAEAHRNRPKSKKSREQMRARAAA